LVFAFAFWPSFLEHRAHGCIASPRLDMAATGCFLMGAFPFAIHWVSLGSSFFFDIVSAAVNWIGGSLHR
jgi:hypothetical protein